ncbi:O-fucosyltransferase 16-like isoform X6 [Rhodamnia argentea]|nr:O-fucosyltransferase 16-like isoform X6 [Rhodamnia argentea]
METWKLINEKKISMDERCHVLTLQALCRGGCLAVGLNLLANLGESHHVTHLLDVYNYFLRACVDVRSELYADCLDLMEHRFVGKNEATYLELLEIAVWKQSLSAVRHIWMDYSKHYNLDLPSLRKFIWSFTRLRDLKSAYESLQLMVALATEGTLSNRYTEREIESAGRGSPPPPPPPPPRMALPRRRHNWYHRLRRLSPVIVASSCALLLLFSLLSFFARPPIEVDRRRSHHHRSKISDGVDNGAAATVSFRVPKSGGKLQRDIWSSRNSEFYCGCSNASTKFARAAAITQPNRYLMIATSGGLNQQRTGITDAVVAARILNATLVVPKLDQKSFWKDASDFSEIFDVDWFISSLANDVKIIKQLPKKGGKPWSFRSMRVPRKCSERCYHNRVLPVLLKRHVVQLTKFDYRLSNKLDTGLQKLRCRVNYHALKFTNPIRKMGDKLVQRMRMRSKNFIALHLRFEPDMLAFSGCYYGGGEKEIKELGAIRKRWKTLHIINPDKARRQGKCPLTPEELGLMLRALGYGSDVHIYVASGEIYGGEETLAPLKALFPKFYTKETLASKKELEPFSSFSSRMAALDFIVCDESDVFATNNNGNMARILAGRRRYFGHKPTIRPNAKKLYRLSSAKSNMTWEAFASKVRSYQRGFMGEPMEVRPGRGEFHENPSSCICEDSESKAKRDSSSRKIGKGKDTPTKDEDVVVDDQNSNEDPEWSDPDDEDNGDGLQENSQFNETLLDYDADVVTSDEPELEDILSD